MAMAVVDIQPVRAIDEAEALRISNKIDEELKIERELMRRRKSQQKDVKVMLLGQAESGKSTLQKQFQLYYASHSLEKERPAWRPVVYFNVIKAVRMILEELDHDLQVTTPLPHRTVPSPARSPTHTPLASSPSDSPSTSDPWSIPSPAHEAARNVAREELTQLRTRLLPLVATEDALANDLSGGVTVAGGRTGVYVRAGWQALLSSAANRTWSNSAESRVAAQRPMNDLVARLLATSREDVDQLWRHPRVRTLVRLRKVRLEESAAFFLDAIDRIAQTDYLPSTEDILNVRLQTLGVTEHSFDISLSGTHVNWLLYDVGGARHAWIPYFEDATAIIFLAPISAFDQYLEEDPRTNRIDDSLQLFTIICSNKLLKKAHLVLMLNKTDLLRQKLQAGIKVRKYITSYGDRLNQYEEVSEYFRAHFLQVHRRNDISKRALYAHFTSMLDIKATQKIIVNVGEAIIRSYITEAGLT